MPPGDCAQEKALKQEEKLISQLEHLELTNDLIKVLRDQVLWLLDGKFFQHLSTERSSQKSESGCVLLLH